MGVQIPSLGGSRASVASSRQQDALLAGLACCPGAELALLDEAVRMDISFPERTSLHAAAEAYAQRPVECQPPADLHF